MFVGSTDELIFVMVNSCVFFEVWAEFLNIQMGFVLEGLKLIPVYFNPGVITDIGLIINHL
jgi:hypothetical protein